MPWFRVDDGFTTSVPVLKIPRRYRTQAAHQAPDAEDGTPGFAMNLTDGILRLRYRDDWSHPRPMPAGERQHVTVSAAPIANLFRRGHRIRLDISGSNFPKYDINPQTGEPEARATGQRVARLELYLDSAHLRLHVQR